MFRGRNGADHGRVCVAVNIDPAIPVIYGVLLNRFHDTRPFHFVFIHLDTICDGFICFIKCDGFRIYLLEFWTQCRERGVEIRRGFDGLRFVVFKDFPVCFFERIDS